MQYGEMYQCPRENYKNSDFCIFHYGYETDLKNYDKDKITEKENDFNNAFEAYLQNLSLPEYNFIGTLFPNIGFRLKNFKKNIDFRFAFFTEKADFSNATFSEKTNFSNATFSKKTDFSNATFSKKADFRKATFSEDTYFSNAIFSEETDSSNAIFSEETDSSNATFSEETDSSNATFSEETDSSNAILTIQSNFRHATFQHATFKKNADFFNATFKKNADFSFAIFTKKVDFSFATLSKKVDFWHATFLEIAEFNYATFLEKTDFRNAKFENIVNFENSLFFSELSFIQSLFANNVIFNNTFVNYLNLESPKSDSFFYLTDCCVQNLTIKHNQFKYFTFINTNFDAKKFFKAHKIVQPEKEINPRETVIAEEIKKVVNIENKPQKWDFANNDLTNFSFIECNLEIADFTSAKIQNTHFDNCQFGQFEGRSVLYPHKNILEIKDSKEKNEKLHKLQFVYQRFKRVLMDNHNFELAQQFNYQELEIRRTLSNKYTEPFFLYLYKKISNYGTNYVYPLLWLLGTILVFSILLLYYNERFVLCLYKKISNYGTNYTLLWLFPTILVFSILFLYYTESCVLYLYKKISNYGTNYIYPLLWLIPTISIFPVLLLYKTWNFNITKISCELYTNTLFALLKLVSPIKISSSYGDSIFNEYINNKGGITIVLIFYIVVIALITLFIQALSRNFKR